MKYATTYLITAISVLTFFFVGCGDDDDNDTGTDTDTDIDTDADSDTDTDTDSDMDGDTDTDSDTENDDSNLYSGSASHGDLVTFSVDKENQTYEVDNETTGESDSGEYTILEDNLAGLYEVAVDDDLFFAVELDDKVIAANFPTGNDNNEISFGVSATIDNNEHLAQIQGDYTYIVMGNAPVNGSTAIKEWGVLTVTSSAWTKVTFATDVGDGSILANAPDLFDGTLPLDDGDETGTWSVNGEHKERLNVTVDSDGSELTGYSYADADFAVFLLDLGEGNGFMLGYRIVDDYTFSDIAGDYKFVDVWREGFRGAGTYSIGNDGSVTWAHKDQTGATAGGAFSLTASTNALANLFWCTDMDIEGESYLSYLVISGDIIMHFLFENETGDFAAYGAGARI